MAVGRFLKKCQNGSFPKKVPKRAFSKKVPKRAFPKKVPKLYRTVKCDNDNINPINTERCEQ
jgi:hypothetical protein